MKPAITLSLPESHSGRALGSAYAELQRRAALILRDPDVQCGGWSEGNFSRRLQKLVPERACILTLFVESAEPSSALTVYLSKNWSMRFGTLLAQVDRHDFSPTFLFLIVSDDVDDAELRKALSELRVISYVCWCRPAHASAMVSLSCEFSQWWGLQSLFHREVQYQYLRERLSILVEQLNSLLADGVGISEMVQGASDTNAWTGGMVAAQSVDIDKFTDGARAEQVADALKRLADAAYAPRLIHASPKERLVSTQALFWFTELARLGVDFEWLSQSRFAYELFGGVLGRPTHKIEFEALPGAPDRRLLEALLADFVRIPSGTYPIGTESDSTDSEPPAVRIFLELPEFLILRRPVTVSDWLSFSATSLVPSQSLSHPAIYCDAFQALRFAEHIDTLLHEHGLLGEELRVTLPSEYEWEVAARGATGREYPWGDSFELGRCNCDLVLGATTSDPSQFSPAGDSAFGCQDMAGNVREWTRSYGGVPSVDWQPHSAAHLLRDLVSLQPQDRLIIRGGSYSYDPECVKTWVRNTQMAERRDGQTGFRLVISRC